MPNLVLAVGGLLVVLGLALIPLPGPGFAVIVPGLVLVAVGVVLKVTGRPNPTRQKP